MAAQPDTVRLLRTEIPHWFQGQGVGDENLAAAIALATSEAVGNVVVTRTEPTAGASSSTRSAVTTTSLSGSGQRPGPHGPLGTRTGLGLPVIGRVSNGVTVASDAAGTTVSMRFALRNPAPRPRLDRFSSSRRPLIGIG